MKADVYTNVTTKNVEMKTFIELIILIEFII